MCTTKHCLQTQWSRFELMTGTSLFDGTVLGQMSEYTLYCVSPQNTPCRGQLYSNLCPVAVFPILSNRPCTLSLGTSVPFCFTASNRHVLEDLRRGPTFYKRRPCGARNVLLTAPEISVAFAGMQGSRHAETPAHPRAR